MMRRATASVDASRRQGTQRGPTPEEDRTRAAQRAMARVYGDQQDTQRPTTLIATARRRRPSPHREGGVSIGLQALYVHSIVQAH
jgi:hypothetical protein